MKDSPELFQLMDEFKLKVIINFHEYFEILLNGVI